MHRDGFGFVIPEATSLDASLKARLAGDVFIPPHAIGSSMHGDRVLVEVSAIRTDGRAEGRIVRSLSRAHPTVVGIFHYGQPPQLRQADRRKSYAGNRHPAGDGDSRSPLRPPMPRSEERRARQSTRATAEKAIRSDRVIGDEAAVHDRLAGSRRRSRRR